MGAIIIGAILGQGTKGCDKYYIYDFGESKMYEGE
jgi:hypothetical protein